MAKRKFSGSSSTRPWKRRRVTRRRRRAFNSVTIPRGPVAQRTIVRMRYCTPIQLNAGVGGSVNYHRFRANSIYDPDFTGVGHQPYGHDTYATLYNHYVVLGSKINVTFVPAGNNSASETSVVGIKTDDDTTALPANVDAIAEASNTVYRVVTDSDNFGKVSLRRTYSPSRFFGIPKNNVKQKGNTLMTNFGSNPSDEVYFTLYTAPVDPLMDAGTINCWVTISYMVMCIEPKDIVQS